MKYLSIILSLLLAFFVAAVPAWGIYAPDFPSCINPQGSLRAEYTSGDHGIVGDTSTHTGSDRVYDVAPGTHIQCFCSVTGQGIQTNWWKTSSLSADQLKQLTYDGWTYVSDGSAWGLESTGYMAKNSRYSCGALGSGGGDILGASTLALTGNIVFILQILLLGVASLGIGIYLQKRSE